MDSITDQQMISNRLAVAEPLWLETLRSLAVFPPAPNDFSEAAAVAVAQTDVGTVQALAWAGFLGRTALARYSIPKLVVQSVSAVDLDRAAGRRMIDHFRAYARAHSNEFSVLSAEYQNLIEALALSRSLDRAAFSEMVLNLSGVL